MCLVQTLLVLILTINCVRINSQLAEGEGCRSISGKRGTCLLLHKCPAAVAAIRMPNKPQICGFENKIPIVCCENIGSRSASIAARITILECVEYKTTSIPTTTTTTTTIKPSNATDDDIHIDAIGGVDALPLEFPHMAILGYGPTNDIKWLCGGSLISEDFVLTAAHCIYSKYGNVSTINLGSHSLDRATESIQTFTVKSTFQHPEYSRFQNYHDIALIELDHPANIQAGVKPACLHTTKTLASNSFTATGWGATELYGGITQTLQKVDLKFVLTGTCAGYYKNQKRLANGLIDEWQLCADGGNQRADTCQGDSGGPLHLPLNEDVLYTVAGITSFGLKCALVPAVYTRVSYYVPWIESIVWSN